MKWNTTYPCENNYKWQFLVFNYNANDAVTHTVHKKHAHGIFTYEYIKVMTFECIFGHYANKRFVEIIPQFHADYRYGHCSHIYADIFSDKLVQLYH